MRWIDSHLLSLGKLTTLWEADKVDTIAEAVYGNGLMGGELVAAIGLDLDDLVASQAVQWDRHEL